MRRTDHAGVQSSAQALPSITYNVLKRGIFHNEFACVTRNGEASGRRIGTYKRHDRTDHSLAMLYC